jgi:DNA ligase-1
VKIYSRTLDNVTHRFPEIEAAARSLERSVILDGEIVAFSDRILPFAIIQKRLGRRIVSEKLLAEAPVVFFAFDLLFLDGEALFEKPLRERLERMREVVETTPHPPSAPFPLTRGEGHSHNSRSSRRRADEGSSIRIGDSTPIRDAAHVDELFDAARVRANEGLVIKDPESIYTPGRRGKSWLKYKKALATLDCVVTYAQWGNGKRRAVLPI